MSEEKFFERLVRDLSQNFERSNAHERMLLSHAFLLNGGALIALPAFQSPDLLLITKGSGLLIPVAFLSGIFFAFLSVFSMHLQALSWSVMLKDAIENDMSKLEIFLNRNKMLIHAAYGSAAFSYTAFLFGSFYLIMRVSSLHV